MKIWRIVILVFGGGLAGLSSAEASEERFYIGINYGMSKYDTGISNLTGSAKLDEEDSAIKIYGGFEFNDWFALELHHVDLGEATLKGNTGDQFMLDGDLFVFAVDNAKLTFEGTSIGLSAVFKLPVSETIMPYIKAGLQQWDAKVSASSPGISSSISDDGTDPFFGLGLGIALSDNFSVRGEYERYTFDEDDVEYLSAGVVYRF